LADLLLAQVVPLAADHFVNVSKPQEFSAATAQAVRLVLTAQPGRSATAPSAH
jgi:hypothetical protein